MRHLSIQLLVVLAAAFAGPAQATIYYVSPSGNDANNGTSQATPWRTIDRLNQMTYQVVPGDQILFQRGGTYRGELIWGVSGTAATPVTYGAYGTGAAPVISGSKLVTGWTAHSGNIYKVSVGQLVTQVYVGGVRMDLARTPNAGTWYRNSQASGNTLQSNNITQSSGYFTGSRCVLRTTASTIDTLRVSAHNGNTLTFANNPSNGNMGPDDWGFFLENKLALLDAQNEWFYEASTGMLYLWAANGVNPSSLTVEACVYYSGVNCYPGRNYAVIQDITFRHQRYAGVHNGSAGHVTVTGCTFEDVYHGIRSYGSYDNYSNNTFNRTLASGCIFIESNSTFSNNVLTNIATIPGQGESSWGYFGIRGIGTGNVIRSNRFTNIGYTAIEVQDNHLVEKNVISSYGATLNDGGGINFDHANGLMIQDNIIQNPIGGLDGSATNLPHYQHLGVGIYFGNTSIVNTTVQRNTLYNIPGVGINVDHCMNSNNLQIKDNVIFNAKIGMSISDYSNYNGPYAVAPYHVPNYNDVYSGNQIYCTNKDQLYIRFYNCYSANQVDFGTFSNNKYFNPYNEVGIFQQNLFSGQQKWYTLERWQVERGEDAGSTRSPLRQSDYATTSELSGNLVVNGDFAANVNGWGGWPTNAQVSRVTTNLDNGCLKAYLPNNQVSSTFSMRNPDWFSVSNGAWYRMRVSVQAPAEGELICGLKAQSTLSDPYAIYERRLPFGPERRDLEIYFQSNITDVAQVRLINSYLDPTYYLDNVDVRRVNVQAVDPMLTNILLVNDQATAQNMSLPAGCWSDISGTVLSGTATVPAYAGRIFYKVADTQCATQGSSGTVSAKVLLGGAVNWANYIMRDDLRNSSLIPLTEPYTAMGYVLENPAATVSALTLANTGNTAIVDWVVVEVRNPDATYTVAARRACLLRRDGTVVTTTGDPVITFSTTTTVGKRLAVRHRNHLGAMSGSALSANGQLVDFSLPTTSTYGNDAQQTDGSRRALWPGNCNADISVKYTGAGNDRDPILSFIGGTIPTAIVSGYRPEDVNMDGIVKYTGVSNDRDAVLTIIGGTIPTSTKPQQLP